MLIDTNELCDLTVQVARQEFATRVFARRALMEAVERDVRACGLWERKDDEDSGSSGRKSKGLARIDWSISKAKMEGRLLNVGRDRWQAPSN